MRTYLNTINNPWRVFDEWLTAFPYDLFNNTWRTRSGSYPRINVWESGQGLVVEAEVAGVDPEKMEVAAEANVLTLKGEKEQADGATSEFQRSFSLPFELDNESIKATMKNGVLTVSIPRKAAAEKRNILIGKE